MWLCRVWHMWSLQMKPRLLRQCWKWTAWMWRATKSLLLLVTLLAETWWINLVPTGRTWCLARPLDRKFTFLFHVTWNVLICNCRNKSYFFVFPGEEEVAPSSHCSLVPCTDKAGLQAAKWRTGPGRHQQPAQQQRTQPERRNLCQTQTLPRCFSASEKMSERITTAFTLKAILCPYKLVFFCKLVTRLPFNLSLVLIIRFCEICLNRRAPALHRKDFSLDFFRLVSFEGGWQAVLYFKKSVSYLCVNILYLKLYASCCKVSSFVV